MMLHRKTEKNWEILCSACLGHYGKTKSGNFFKVHVYVNLDARILSVYLLPKRPTQSVKNIQSFSQRKLKQTQFKTNKEYFFKYPK
jgi:uncharacterized protein YbbC (DUF1343 family)